MASVSQFPGGDYPLGQFPRGEYPLGATVYEGGEGWPPVQETPPEVWPYTIGAPPTFRGKISVPSVQAARRSELAPSFRSRQVPPSRHVAPRRVRASMRGFGDTVVYQGADTGWPPKNAMPQDWLYTIGGIDAFRVGRRRQLQGLGDDTPDAIRIYVPRLAAGLYAIDLYQTGLTPDVMAPSEAIETQRWNSRLATKFTQEAKRLLGFVPVVHEPEGADVIYAHMAGAASHAEAERIWRPMQVALNQARNATGVGAPADPYAGQPRAWEAAPAPGPAPAPEAPARRSVLDLVLGAAMVVGGIVLF